MAVPPFPRVLDKGSPATTSTAAVLITAVQMECTRGVAVFEISFVFQYGITSNADNTFTTIGAKKSNHISHEKLTQKQAIHYVTWYVTSYATCMLRNMLRYIVEGGMLRWFCVEKHVMKKTTGSIFW